MTRTSGRQSVIPSRRSCEAAEDGRGIPCRSTGSTLAGGDPGGDPSTALRACGATPARDDTHEGAIVTDPEYAAFMALDPFFDIVQRGLAGLVDGDHYFDTIADDAEFEFRYRFPRWPQDPSWP